MKRQTRDILVAIFLITLCALGDNLHCQDRWYKPSKNDYIGYGMMAVAGVAKGYNQAIIHHHYGAGNKFWDSKISWQNKYADWPTDQSAAFPGSKGILVILTDGAHLTEFANTSFTIGGTGFLCWNMKDELKNIPKNQRWLYIVWRKILLPLGIRTLTFELTFSKLKR